MITPSVLALLEQDLIAGSLQVRLAKTPEEVRAAQALRYQIFYEEMGATASPEVAASKRDFDSMDDCCEHLLVLDNAREGMNKVIGTYRLIRREAAAKNGGYYSASEFDITPLINYPGEILELGRSCIHKNYRTGTVMSILWKGLAAYMFRHDIKLMFGCASMHGTDPQEHAVPLSYLYHYHLAPEELRARALPDVYVDMNILPKNAFDPDHAFDDLSFNNIKLDPKAGQNSLPPLIKGYLRVGCVIGDGAYIDHQFNTTDVCIIFRTELITDRYLRHYERMEEKLTNAQKDRGAEQVIESGPFNESVLRSADMTHNTNPSIN
ncbi:MAG: GNAT family N-acetyltransferase [Alphaproteobacteria bacterium]|nr:GNAT family N-acetyltransferase [Alphaproteobacteria bacterium]